MVAEVLGDYPNESAALRAVAEKLGIGSAETLRNWVRRDQVDSGQRPGTTTEESAQIKAMKKEIAELKRANDILKAAAVNSTGQRNTRGGEGCGVWREWVVRACRTRRSGSCGTAGRPASRSVRSPVPSAGHRGQSSRSSRPTADTFHLSDAVGLAR
ncbi:transposase [Kitasatospora sp. MMS16-BH015]|uniref:transposase n=1 Tax=Kitasatospora sp. MMS16-BH015 TaxID=2018025 RepID=UPI00352F9C0A